MAKKFASKDRTVCEVLREINSMHQENTPHDEDVRAKLMEAYHMTKRMTKKLYSYSREYDKGWWEKNQDYKKDIEERMNQPFVLEK